MSDLRKDLGTLSGDAAPKVEEKPKEDGSRQETVTIGDFAGTKTLSFKIVQKPVDYKGALIGGSWHNTQ